jgi:hypothetical protein
VSASCRTLNCSLSVKRLTRVNTVLITVKLLNVQRRISVCVRDKCCLVAYCFLVGDYLLLRSFEPYGIIFMNVCVVTAVAI